MVNTSATPLCSFAFGTLHSFITGKAGMDRKEKLILMISIFFLVKSCTMSNLDWSRMIVSGVDCLQFSYLFSPRLAQCPRSRRTLYSFPRRALQPNLNSKVSSFHIFRERFPTVPRWETTSKIPFLHSKLLLISLRVRHRSCISVQSSSMFYSAMYDHCVHKGPSHFGTVFVLDSASTASSRMSQDALPAFQHWTGSWKGL